MPGGEAATVANLTISTVLAAYLADEKARLAAKTYGLYADVIDLLQHSLDGYALRLGVRGCGWRVSAATSREYSEP